MYNTEYGYVIRNDMIHRQLYVYIYVGGGGRKHV